MVVMIDVKDLNKSILKVLGKAKNRLKFYLIMVPIFLFFMIFSMVFLDIVGVRPYSKTVKVKIPNDVSAREISKILKENQIIRYELPFRVISVLKKVDHDYKSGNRKLSSRMSYSRIFLKLTTSPSSDEEDIIKVVIPEGFEIRKIINTLESKVLINKDKFNNEISNCNFQYSFLSNIKRKDNKLEGYLFPATYEIQKGENEHLIIDKMIRKFEVTVIPLYDKYKESTNDPISLDEIITIASIIEKETFGDDMEEISSVFHNRLKQNMLLESCATVMYASDKRKEILSVNDTKIKSKYNTYINKGLPPGPIACPGEKAILAAMYPKKTDFLFFRKNRQGTKHIFSKNFVEHLNCH